MFELIRRAAGEKAQASHVDPDDRNLVPGEKARPTQQRSVAPKRQQRVQLLRRLQNLIGPLPRQIGLEMEFEVEAWRETSQRPERGFEAFVARVANDAQSDRPAGFSHPANASDSSMARTRCAMPSGLRPQCSS